MIPVRTHTIATAAHNAVKEHEADDFRKSYASLAHKLPGLILQNGLAQATGFLLAKHKPEHLALLADLAAVLRAGGVTDAADGEALHGAVIDADLPQTMRLTREALVAAGWLKRYVQGVLRLGATGEPKEEDAPHAD
jgi:CRISPR-associated protein Cmr5